MDYVAWHMNLPSFRYRVLWLISLGKATISLKQLGPMRLGLWVLQVEKDGHAR